MNTFKVTDDIIYVGVNDTSLDLFEGQYDVPEGIAYNSYVILDEQTAVMDAVDQNFIDEWLAKVETVLDGRAPDYLIVQHMEPDHSAGIAAFADRYPQAKLVGNAMTFLQMKQFFDRDFSDRALTVKDGETLSLGQHQLTFVFAPMVHWPEVMMTYDTTQKVLFSADGFGKFGALTGEEGKEDWACEARRYYFGIVGKYGMQVQNVLKKAAALEIDIICPLHGPVLTEDLGYYLDLYDTWSSYRPESKGVTLAFTSVYGNTGKAARQLAKMLEQAGVKVALHDLARTDMHEAVEDAFRYDRLVLATTTYNGDIFPYMKEFIHHLTERGYQNRTVGLIENGTWAPMAAKIMKGMFEKSKNITFTETTVTIRSALNAQSKAQLEALGKELCDE